MKMKKSRQKEYTKEKNYNEYILSKKEKIGCAIVYMAVCVAFAELFYKSLIPAAAFLFLTPIVFKKYSEILLEKRKEKLKGQFVTGMSAFAAAIRSGYSPENAIGEARLEVERADGTDAMISKEFKTIERKLSCHETIEDALLELSKRTGIEEIEDMAGVFLISKRYGGSLSAVVTNTVNIMKEKKRVREEISTMMTAKKLEYRIMCLMPAGILAYVNLTSPEFVEMLYESLLGRIAMTVALGAYVFAVLIGEKTMKVSM